MKKKMIQTLVLFSILFLSQPAFAEAETGWKYENNHWYYQEAGGIIKNRWLHDGKDWYYLGGDGAMKTGWLLDGEKWYYLESNGAMKTGWVFDGGKWYYLESSGTMKTGWVYDANSWYYLREDGSMARGWLQLGGHWYLLNTSGVMQTGWLEDDGKWYYFTKDGNMLTGKHNINGVVYEFSINGALNKGSVTTSTTYNMTIQDMIDKQMSVLPKTDKYRQDQTYVHSAYIQMDPVNPSVGTVTTSPLNVREGASEGYRVVGTLHAGDTVEILSTVGDWHEISFSAWRYAKPEDVAYYVNPTNFSVDSAEYYQFLLLSKNTGASADELNRKVLAGKGILDGKAQAFVEASLKENINELYLISHALLETGNGTSELSRGILVDTIDGVPVEPMVVYNMFGIQARDEDPIRLGAEYAYQNGWFTPEAAIIGGAKYIGERYIHNPTYQQDTLYEMRWNPKKPGTHQYATDIGWAAKQVNNLKKLYDSLSWYTLHFDVPVFK